MARELETPTEDFQDRKKRRCSLGRINSVVMANKEVELDQHSLKNLKSVEAARNILKKFDNYCISLDRQLVLYSGILRNYEEYIKESRSQLDVAQE